MSTSRQNWDDAELRDVESAGLPRPQRVAVSAGGVASTQHYLATEAAGRMLEVSGNAVDAAVAAPISLGGGDPAADPPRAFPADFRPRWFFKGPEPHDTQRTQPRTAPPGL